MVVTAARSVPASGSLNSWHQISSAARIGGRYRRRWASVPWAMSVGPTMASPTRLIPGGTPAAAASWAQITRCATGRPRPPCSTGHPSPAHPPAANSRCQALPRTTCSVSLTSANTSDGPPGVR